MEFYKYGALVLVFLADSVSTLEGHLNKMLQIVWMSGSKNLEI